MPLNPRQLKFVERYLLTGNATQSYIDAYPNSTRKAAEANAARLIRDDRVQQLIAPAQRQAEQERSATIGRIEITRDRIRNELARLSFVNPKRVFREDGSLKAVHELDDDTAASLASVEVEEELEPAGVDEGQEPQAHGGSLRRRRSAVVAVRTTKIKFWDKVRALKALGDTEPGVWVREDSPAGHTTNVNVAVMSDAELARRIDALEGGTPQASGAQRLLPVASAPPPEVQLGVEPPAGNPLPPPEGDGRGGEPSGGDAPAPARQD